MFKKSYLGVAIAAAIAMPGIASAEVETTVVLKNETAVFQRDGMRTGEATSMLDNDGAGHTFSKFENSARIFFNGDIGEESSWHGELNIIHDAAAESGYKGYEAYSQHDWFRELYVDTTAAGWDWRIGKQQQVWGTADGIKLLDIINPTDFRELNQNSMEESRIPVFMIAGERYLDNGGNIQIIISEAEENKIAGLNADGDAGHPFIMKGVDAITGQVNGFLNITPNLASTAQTFTNGSALLATVFNNAIPGLGLPTNAGLVPFAGFTVDGFANTPFSFDGVDLPGTLQVGPGAGVDVQGFQLLNLFAQCGFDPTCSGADPNANLFVTNLMPVGSANPFDTSWDPANRTSAFEHMPLATFATFNTFSGNVSGGFGVPGTSATTSYVRDYPDAYEPNFGARFRDSLDNGLNYSVNYFYGYDANPAVDLSWHDRTTGEELEQVFAGTQPDGSIDPADNRTRDQIIAGLAAGSTTNFLLRNAAGDWYGSYDPTTGAINSNTNNLVLRFTETVDRTHNLGGSFDYTLDTETLGGVVLRGEFLYQKDTKQPVVDNLYMDVGGLGASALSMQEADMFKYVLGVDVTVLTNMLASFQFIQFRNLDYVDQAETCNVQYFDDPTNPGAGGPVVPYSCTRYTADMATMNPTNGLNRAEENKEFYSLFFSKPFGESDLGRWNNIIIYEEGGGYWDRIDAEYSLSDELVLTGELNFYWGNENTTFGQFKNSSNAQIGVKWIME